MLFGEKKGEHTRINIKSEYKQINKTKRNRRKQK